MTSEIRTSVEFQDVTGLEFECPKCHAKVLHPFHRGQNRKKISHCPICGENWYITQRPTDALDQIAAFIATFDALSAHKDIFAKIRLSVAEGTLAAKAKDFSK